MGCRSIALVKKQCVYGGGGGGVDIQTASQNETEKGKGRWTSNRNKGLMKWDFQ